MVTHRLLPLVSLALLAAVLATIPTVADAQPLQPAAPLGGESPSTGVRLPAPALVGSGDASSLEVNPAALGLLRAWSLTYHHAGLRKAGRVGGTGDGFFVAAPLPYVRSLVVGAGLQWLRPPTTIGYADSVKLGFGLAINAGTRVSLGFAYHGFIADEDPYLDRLETIDLGLVVRPTQWLAAAAAVRDLTTPLYDGLPLQRVYDFELAFRPALSQRFEVAAGVRVGERRGDVDPRLRLTLEPRSGLRLLGDVEWIRRDFYRTGERANDVRATVGLGLNLERIGMIFSTTLGRRMPEGGPLVAEDARSVFQGAGVTLSLSGERRPPLFESRRRLIELTLKGRLDQATMVNLVGLVTAVERRTDVVGLLLRIERLAVGWGQAQELRSLIARLRRAGKVVQAYVHAPGAAAYYVASAADRVLIDPDGGVNLAGLAVQALYLRGLLDLVGVDPQFVKIAEYKSAPEALTRKGASRAAAEVREALLDDLFGQLVAGLASDRKKKPAELRKLIDEGPFDPRQALKVGLVDKLVAPDELKSQVARELRATIEPPAVLQRAPDRWPVGPVVAVVVIEGDIVRGKSQRVPLIGRETSGDESVVAALDWARQSSRVRGIVLRVNSPGGSALASAHIWRAVRRAGKVKPVIVSLADVAASGGYYAACGGHRIYAQPGTVTGSIGIFSGKLNVRGLLDRLGIRVESAQRGRRALLSAFDRNYSDEERALVLRRLRYHYDSFLGAVASGRKLDRAGADKVARGRVWTGRQAQWRKLVDESGGLLEALREAKRRGGLSPDRPIPVVVLPRLPRTLLGRALKLAGGEQSSLDLPPAARRVLEAIPPSLLQARANEPMTRLPFQLHFSD